MVTHRASYLNEVLSIRAQESEEYDTLFSGMTHLNEVLSIRAQELAVPVVPSSVRKLPQ